MPDPSFRELFGRDAERRASAPGRVNLIGEHTDYNGGFVLPTAIPQRTAIELARRDDRTVQAWSRDASRTQQPVQYQLGAEQRGRGWLDYVQGVTDALTWAGHRIDGFDLRVTSEVPLGSGLSSSASLSVAILRGLRACFDLILDDLALALLAQRAENVLVGAPVGVMDPLAVCLADVGVALFIDTRTLAIVRVPIPAELDLVVIDSGVAHEHAGGDYQQRRAESEQAATLLGIPQLRDLPLEQLWRAAGLPEPLGRRVTHVVTENARVVDAVRALEQRDFATLGALFSASHRSMRDDYQVSVPAIDVLVDLAAADPDIVAARMTGGGFGGSIVALARRGTGARAGARVARGYGDQTGRQATLLVPEVGR